MNGITISQPGLRMVYKSAVDEVLKSGNTLQQAKLTQAYLRAEIPLVTGTSQYPIPIINTQNFYNSTSPSEKKIVQQDVFFIGQLGVFLAVKASASDTSYQIYPYPSLYAGFTAAEQLAMNNFYNGWISLTVDNNVLIPEWDLWRHYNTNQTQGGAPASAPLDQFTGGADGWYPMEPNVTHIGSTNIVMTINLPNAITALPANCFAIVMHRGVKAQNITVVNN
jgi:hypothetical protein